MKCQCNINTLCLFHYITNNPTSIKPKNECGNPMSDNNSDNNDDSIEQKFENLYPNYDYSLESSYNEKDTRKRKRMKTMY